MSVPIIHSPVELAREIVAIPSVNPMNSSRLNRQKRQTEVSIQGEALPARSSADPFYEFALTNWLEDFFRSIEVPFERQWVDQGRENILAYYESPKESNVVLWDAHQDTVPVDGMTIEPFAARLGDGRLYGRGAADVKGGMAAMLAAFARLAMERPRDSSSVIMCCSCDEEDSALGIKKAVTGWQSSKLVGELMPTAAIVAEPTELNVITEHMGVWRTRISTEGIACHSANPSMGRNAIYDMSRVVHALKRYAEQLSQRVIDEHSPIRASCSIGRIAGGSSVNIVPESCWIELDRRVAPTESLESIEQELHQWLVQLSDVTWHIDKPWVACPGLPATENQRLANELLAQINLVAGERGTKSVPYCTNASTIATMGVPTVVFGPGSIDQAHTKDEFIETDQIKNAAEILYNFARASDGLNS